MTDEINDYYVQTELDEMETMLQDSETTNKQLLDQLEKIRNEFDRLYDTAYKYAETLEYISNELDSL